MWRDLRNETFRTIKRNLNKHTVRTLFQQSNNRFRETTFRRVRRLFCGPTRQDGMFYILEAENLLISFFTIRMGEM